MRIRLVTAIFLLAVPIVSLASPLTTATVRKPTADELRGLSSDAFEAYFHEPDLQFQWTVTDSNSHGWIIGRYLAALYDGSFVFRGGTITCCWDDQMRLTDINEADQIVGSWYLGVFGTADQFDYVAPLIDWSSMADIPANQTLVDMNACCGPWGSENDFRSISEDGKRITTGAGILYLTDPGLSSRASAVPEPCAALLVCSVAALILLAARRQHRLRSELRGPLTGV